MLGVRPEDKLIIVSKLVVFDFINIIKSTDTIWTGINRQIAIVRCYLFDPSTGLGKPRAVWGQIQVLWL